ncbi:VCBS repeat-containing protein, partial [Patescibacteria group bacterium]|nr:VCBS repeat-containing protein [Patescibacteria group bacterium]
MSDFFHQTKVKFGPKIFLTVFICSLFWTGYVEAREIDFAGYSWQVKNGYFAPGPNHWGEGEEFVSVDADQRLHLRVKEQNNLWSSSEVYLPSSLGFGNYSFEVEGQVDQTDPSLVAGLFLYQDDYHEIDIEFSRWKEMGEPWLHYTVQPYWENELANTKAFDADLKNRASTHQIIWTPTAITFRSFQDNRLLKEWTYQGENNFSPGQERVHLNYWMIDGDLPTDKQSKELIIKDFSFTPLTSQVSANKPYLLQANKIMTAPGEGGGPQVRRFSAKGNSLGEDFWAYNRSFRGGARLSAGDIDQDGQAEVIAGAGPGGGPQVRVFEGQGQVKPLQFFAFHPQFRGGVDVATGDVDGDGKDEIAVCQFSSGQAWVKVYRYNSQQEVLGHFNAFGSSEVGCTVAMGDTDADGLAEVIVGAGQGGGPQVRVFEANGTPSATNFFAFERSSRSGIDVAAADFDLDGRDEIMVSKLQGDQTWIKVFGGADHKSVIS